MKCCDCLQVYYTRVFRKISKDSMKSTSVRGFFYHHVAGGSPVTLKKTINHRCFLEILWNFHHKFCQNISRTLLLNHEEFALIYVSIYFNKLMMQWESLLRYLMGLQIQTSSKYNVPFNFTYSFWKFIFEFCISNGFCCLTHLSG